MFVVRITIIWRSHELQCLTFCLIVATERLIQGRNKKIFPGRSHSLNKLHKFSLKFYSHKENKNFNYCQIFEDLCYKFRYYRSWYRNWSLSDIIIVGNLKLSLLCLLRRRSPWSQCSVIGTKLPSGQNCGISHPIRPQS